MDKLVSFIVIGIFACIMVYMIYDATERVGIFEGVLKTEGKVIDYHRDATTYSVSTVIFFENEQPWNPFSWSTNYAIRLDGKYEFDIGRRYLIITEDDGGQTYAYKVLSIKKVG